MGTIDLTKYEGHTEGLWEWYEGELYAGENRRPVLFTIYDWDEEACIAIEKKLIASF